MKKILALFTLAALCLATVAMPVTAAGTSSETQIFSQDFEGSEFTITMTTSQIAAALGWTTWDSNVADLKIVETVWVREFSGVSGDAALKTLVKWDEGSSHEYGNRNHRIIDIQAVEAARLSTSGSKLPDLATMRGYKTYSKQLLIIPKVANADITVMLKDNIDISNLAIDESIVADWEFTANKLTTFGWEADSTDIDFADTSSLGMSYGIGAGNVSAAVQVDGTLVQSATSATSFYYYGNVSWNDWNRAQRNSDSGVKLYGDVHAGYGGNYSINYTTDATTDPVTTKTLGGYMLYHASSANGLTYGLRTQLSPYSGYNSYVRFAHNNDADKADPAWHAIGGDYAAVTGTARNLMKDSDKMSVSLNYSDSGMSFYLDNISISKVKSGAETVTIKVDNKDFTALAGQEIPVAALVDNIDGFLLALGKGANNEEVVYGLGDKITPSAGMEITPYTVDLSITKAEMRTDLPVGIRWVTTIDKDSAQKLEDLKTKGLISKVEIGTVITPESYAALAGGATMAKLETLASNSPYVLAKGEFGKWYATGETTYSFAGSVVKILDAHKAMDYVGRGFIKLTIPASTEGGEETTTVIYAPTSDTSSVANVKELATATVNDANNGLSEAILAEVKKYMQ